MFKFLRFFSQRLFRAIKFSQFDSRHVVLCLTWSTHNTAELVTLVNRKHHFRIPRESGRPMLCPEKDRN